MNPNDHQLIVNLAARLKQAQPVNKDTQANELIVKEIASQPDSLYLLTQAVLLQEQALRSLQQQVSELQAELQRKRGFFSRWRAQRPSAAGYASMGPGAMGGAQSSFLSSALSTAAGVAGGMFLFEGLSHLFGGHSASSLGGIASESLDAGGSDFLKDQTQMLDDGFGTGDGFMDSNDDLGGGSFDEGFGGGDDLF